tara:strand:- start:2420 stop:4657 length:2238 start_codon:yes stop_codon:yes gene_type:complete
MAKRNEDLKESRNILSEMEDNITRYNEGLKQADTYTQKMTKNNTKILDALIKSRKETGISGKQIKEVSDLTKKINTGELDRVKSQRMQNDLEKKLLRARKNSSKELIQTQIDMLKNMDDTAKAQGRINNLKEAGGELDKAFGGFAGQLKGFLLNPLTAALALLVAFSSQQENIAKQFGAIGVTEFRSELAVANQEFTKLGFSSDDTNKTVSDLANNFGLSVVEASKLSESVAETAKATGMSLDDSTKLIGVLTKTQGLSGEQANELIRSTQALAKANNVAPDKVLADIAGNTEQFAQFAKDGGENILRAAVQARKLGISLDTVAKTAEGLLNFQDSLTKEIKASTLIGRQLNLQKARELALAGDLEGVQKEILKQVGTEAEFNEMNTLQRQALADAVGLQSSELQKLVSAEKEAVTLQGALAKQNIDSIVSEKAITSTAGLIQNLKVMGMQLAETLGPAVNFVAQAFGVFVSVLEKLGGLLPPLIALTTIYAGKKLLSYLATEKENTAEKISLLTKLKKLPTMLQENLMLGFNTSAKGANTLAEMSKQAVEKGSIAQMVTLVGLLGGYTAALYANLSGKILNIGATIKQTLVENRFGLTQLKSIGAIIANAAAKLFNAAAAGSGATLGFGTPIMMAMAGAAVAGMIGTVMAAKSVGDLYSGKGPIVTTPQGQSFEGSVRDEVLMAPDIAGAAGGGNTINLENKQNETNSKLERVAAVLEGALSGPKPALATAMGSSVGDSVDGMA